MRLPYPHPDRGLFAAITLSLACVVGCGDGGSSAHGHDDYAVSATDAGTALADYAATVPKVLGSRIVVTAARTLASDDGGLEPADFEPAARDVLGNTLVVAAGEAALEADAGPSQMLSK